MQFSIVVSDDSSQVYHLISRVGVAGTHIISVRSVPNTICPDDDAYLQVPVRRERFPCLYSMKNPKSLDRA